MSAIANKCDTLANARWAVLVQYGWITDEEISDGTQKLSADRDRLVKR